MICRIVSTYPVFTDTSDEPCHIGAAISMYEAGKQVRNLENPPLPRLVAGLPLFLSGTRYPPDRAMNTVVLDAGYSAFDVGRSVLLNSKLPYWTALTRARSAMLVFPVVTVIYVYLLGRYFAGNLAGTLAAIFFSTDPTVLGHASWVTTDVAAAAGFLAATYHGIRFIAHPTGRRAIISGVAMGLAIACKFSCALVLPALGLIILLRWRRFRAWPKLWQSLVVLSSTFITLWACYLFNVGRLNDAFFLTMPPPAWLPSAIVPMPSLVLGILELMHHVGEGHNGYLNGHLSFNGWWYYFPEAIALKSPLALLTGVLLSIITMVKVRSRSFTHLIPLLLPAGMFLAIAMAGKVDIGIRHILPVIPFLYLFVVTTLLRWRQWTRMVLVLLIVFSFVETLALHPDYLAFFNTAGGGPRSGEKYLLDSNLDWGQDQARLKDWLDAHAKGRNVTLRLFGTDLLRALQHEGYEFTPHGQLPPETVPRGLLAVSKNDLHELYYAVYHGPRGGQLIEPRIKLPSNAQPIAHIGYSIDVYDLDRLNMK